MSTTNPRPVASVNQRRSQRILLSVPLFVTGKRTNKAQFSERATTLVGSAPGGLLLLHKPVLAGQILTLQNLATTEEIVCTVIDAGANGVPEVRVEFAQPCPRFWRVSFPPTDWSPRSPEAKRLAQAKAPTPAAAPAAPPPVKK